MNDSVAIFLVVIIAGVCVLVAYAIFNPSQLARIRQQQPERDIEDVRDTTSHQHTHMLQVRQKNRHDIVQAYTSYRMRPNTHTLHNDPSRFPSRAISSAPMAPRAMRYIPMAVQSPPPVYDPQSPAPAEGLQPLARTKETSYVEVMAV